MTERITILCIDDEQSYTDVLQTYLMEILDREFALETVTDPAAGRDFVDENDVDCVVCDYDMPGMDGLELLESVREEYPLLPFVLLTGKGDESVASEAIRLGTTDYVPKPSGIREYKTLANRIGNAISRFRRHRQSRSEAERARVTCDRFGVALVGLDSAWRYIFLNERAETLLGRSEAELFERTVWGSLVDSDGPFSVAFLEARRKQDARTVEENSGPLERRLEIRIYPGPDGVTLAVRDSDESES